MNLKFAHALAAGLTVAGIGITPASAVPVPSLINFETTPNIATGPSIYVAVPGPQTIVTAPATFSGGVVLGFATFFPAIAFATIPNVYGSANFGNGLSETMTIAINPLFATTEVSFALFNGETFNQSYAVNAFNGVGLVATQTLNSIAPNFNSGFGLVDLINLGGITSVTIAPIGAPALWDFLIDTVAFNQNITSVINVPLPPVVPPPANQPPPNQPPPVVFQPLPATPPVRGRRHGHGELELVEVNFGDDLNDIRGSVLLVAPIPAPVTPVPEPATWAMMLIGLAWIGFTQRRVKPGAADAIAA